MILTFLLLLWLRPQKILQFPHFQMKYFQVFHIAIDDLKEMLCLLIPSINVFDSILKRLEKIRFPVNQTHTSTLISYCFRRFDTRLT